MYIKKCRYCGKKAINSGDVCANCRDKLPYVRILLHMVNDIKDKRDSTKKVEECTNECR